MIDDLRRAKALLEVGAIDFGEMRLVHRQVVLRIDGVLGANFCAVAAVNALIGIDENLGDNACAWIFYLGGNGRSGALGHADKILGACVGNYISHNKYAPCFLVS